MCIKGGKRYILSVISSGQYFKKCYMVVHNNAARMYEISLVTACSPIFMFAFIIDKTSKLPITKSNSLTGRHCNLKCILI